MRDHWARWIVEFSANLLCLVKGGKVSYINPGGVKMLGLVSADAIVGKSFSAYVQSDYQDMVEDGLSMLALEGMPLPLKLLGEGGIVVDAELTVAESEDGVDAEFVIEARDITKFIKAAEETRDREATLRGILRTLNDSVVTINEKGIIQTANPATELLFGYSLRDLAGQNISLLMPEPHASLHDGYLKRYLETGDSIVLGKCREMEAKRKNGEIFPIDLSVTKLSRADRVLFIGVIRDITERKEVERHFHHMAHHDSLTGLPNRNLLDDRLEVAVQRARRANGTLALMYIDLDKFKPINDTLGHCAGDQVLKSVAKRMELCLRKSDTVARVGGDEFVIILESSGGEVHPETVSKKLLELVPQPIDVGNKSCAVGCSIGISLFPQDADNLHDLSRCADEAMYAVKDSGRSHYIFYKDIPEATKS